MSAHKASSVDKIFTPKDCITAFNLLDFKVKIITKLMLKDSIPDELHFYFYLCVWIKKAYRL